jgi:hypothetical protein
MFRDVVLQVRLNQKEREKLGKLASADMVSLAEKVRLMIHAAKNPSDFNAAN